MQLLPRLTVPLPMQPVNDPGPFGRVAYDVPMKAPRLSELRMSEYRGSDWRGLDQSDCSPTMIVLEVPSVIWLMRMASSGVTRMTSTPPSETGPLDAVVSVEGCR